MHLIFKACISENPGTKLNSGAGFFILDEINRNMTGLYDMLIQMSEELRITKQELEAMRTRQLETEKELNATKEILNIGNVEIRKVWTQESWLVNIQCKNMLILNGKPNSIKYLWS